MNPARLTVDASYAFCRRVARRAGSSFYPCFWLLRGPKRRAMDALYAFTRYTDDVGDGPQPLGLRCAALARWRHMVGAVLAESPAVAEPIRGENSLSLSSPGHEDGAAMLPAVADTVRRFGIPVAHLVAVLDGVAMDLENRCYETFEDLLEYCDRVASAVGLACIHIWGFDGDGSLELARHCGRAFQLTNILRDLREDATRGRVYLPRQDLRDCGCAAHDFLEGDLNDAVRRLVALELQRARQLYHHGADLIDHLQPDGKRVFGMMLNVYWRLLEEIARRPEDLLTRRIGLTRSQKLRIAARWLCLPPRRSALP